MNLNFKFHETYFRKPDSFDHLCKKALPEIKDKKPNFKEKHKLLNNLFQKKISIDKAKKILMVWSQTIFVSQITKKINPSNDEDLYLNGIIKSIESLKKNLIGWKNNCDTFQINSIILEKEPNIYGFLLSLDKLSDFVKNCKYNKNFGNGDKFNADYIKKNGVFYLFNLGTVLGLSHSTRDSLLFKFIEIITDLESQKISKYYNQYKETEFRLVPEDNSLLNFIYMSYQAVLCHYKNPLYPAHFSVSYLSN